MREQTTAIGQSPMLAGGSDPETVRDPSARAPGRVTQGKATQERVHIEEVLKDDTGSTALLLGTAVLVAFVCALAVIVVIDVAQYVVAVWWIKCRATTRIFESAQDREFRNEAFTFASHAFTAVRVHYDQLQSSSPVN